ncbi:ABC transporter ATP-binding protein [Niveispirillum cyanobacteriorum]|uniref:Microcin ABC transporter ATP-binding protein n=1 Tax=Niveispirillum cyanobacteriorum TaxID=1612173 RepID=A0A2K9NHP0_9PROT|nr:dipeptide ABC transporter ATP-binding protein [Niveispirillum cyanobacteriorum]AUN32607.1 microcin ABC transporter ATP-binding protein [Niveispirillum cyanobacteriorum]GGE76757.1 ABC transporter ATP-binding protein [Niveispirillum cyanobacteriorum]
MTLPLLSLTDVSIRFAAKPAVEALSLEVHPGERLALVGESGSGKTVTALSILRLAAHATISGSIRLEGQELLSKPETEIRQIRGGDIAMIFQEPMTALNPLFTIGSQIVETLTLHEGLSPQQARSKAIQLLARTGVREPERRIDSYPHQLSGGQRQRAMIAMALACRPKLLIADEPTTALDPTVRARIVKLLLDLQAEEAAKGRPMAILLITHDLHLVRRFAQRVAVMERGRKVEEGTTEAIFTTPQHPYTIRLLNSQPVRQVKPLAPDAPILLDAKGLRVEYARPLPGWRGWLGQGRFVAVAGADLRLRAGETIGVVGESGSGKSTLAQALLNLVRPHAGEIIFDGLPIAARSKPDRRKLRARLQVVFQDPFGSLSPKRTVEQTVGEGLELHFPHLTSEERRARIVRVLEEVGLSENVLHAFPHQFSGGQRQRIAIARAIVLEPAVLILDEPTSALDVSIQNQVLDLLRRLQDRYNLAYVLISHDLSVINALAHRVYVLKDGEIVEDGDTEQVIAAPQHPYTQSLIQASL